MPSTPWAVRRSQIGSMSSSAISGAILTMIGRSRRALGDKGCARRHDARKKLVESGGRLQVAQSGRVRRRDVDREVAGDSVEGFDARDVVGASVGRSLLAPMLTPTMPPRAARACEPRQRRRVSAIVEAEPIDQAVVGDEPENARLWVSCLRLRRHGADFGKSAAHAEHGIGHARIFVVACGNADRICEIETENTSGSEADRRQRLAVDRGRTPGPSALLRARLPAARQRVLPGDVIKPCQH